MEDKEKSQAIDMKEVELKSEEHNLAIVTEEGTSIG